MTDLIQKLRDATSGSRELDVEVWCSLERGRRPVGVYQYTTDPKGATAIFRPVPVITTSLDAIIGLIEEKLPGWCKDKRLMIECDPHRGPFWQVRIKRSGDDWPAHGVKHKSAPIALCIALLSALEGES